MNRCGLDCDGKVGKVCSDMQSRNKLYSNLLFFPFGAGSSGVIGVLVYVTVFVITCLTLTGLCVHDLDPSKYFSAGENGER